ncbi:MAG TPA: hypothetical protein VGA08_03950, partial [Candidatus Saccharimonadales bacterium]
SQFILFVDRYWDLTNLSRFVQPVHNIFLLILAETGLIGTVLLLNILMLPILKTWKTLDIRVQLAWLVILITGLFDHYWWSLQAGQLTLFLTLGLTLARMER